MFKAKATRNERITSLAGYVFNVEAGLTYEFPDVMQTEAVLGGCIPVESNDPEPELSAGDRAAAVYNAVVEIISKQDARFIGPEGFPKVAAVRKLTSFDPTIEEIVAACNELKQES